MSASVYTVHEDQLPYRMAPRSLDEQRRLLDRRAYADERFRLILGTPTHPFWDRFWSKVETIGGVRLSNAEATHRMLTPPARLELPDQHCQMWQWKGAKSQGGDPAVNPYGRVRVGANRLVYAHHILYMWKMELTDIPANVRIVSDERCILFTKDETLRHLCMWPGCWRAEVVGTQWLRPESTCSQRIGDESPEAKGLYRNWERTLDGWEIISCTPTPLYPLIEPASAFEEEAGAEPDHA